MRQALAATVIGEGVVRLRQLVTRSGPRFGLVAGNFSFGFYIRTEQLIFAIGGPRLPAGPIHVVVDVIPPAPLDHSIVCIDRDRVATETCTIDLSHAIQHRPDLPLRRQLRAIAPLLTRFDNADVVPGDIAHVWVAVRDAVYRSDLHTARILLQGLGGGLTPTGDDVLAGIILFSHWTDPSAAEPGEAASNAATTDLSRSFLAWAAAGQSIAPIHALLDAAGQECSSSNSPSAHAMKAQFDGAAQAVWSIGSCSGRAILVGLGLAARAWLEHSSF